MEQHDRAGSRAFLTYKFVDATPGFLFVSPGPSPLYHAGTMKIQEMPLNESYVDDHISVREVAKLFERHRDWPGVILIAQHQFVGMLTRHGYEVAHLRVKVDKWLPAQFGLQANSSGGAHLYHYRRVGRAEHRPLLPRRLAAGGG